MKKLTQKLRRFAAARDWERFHSPKNLAMALAVEAAELMEHFQWLSDEQSRRPSAKVRARVEEEIGDVLIYLARLADKLDIDPVAAAHTKMTHNARKYPVAKARGNARKYTEF